MKSLTPFPQAQAIHLQKIRNYSQQHPKAPEMKSTHILAVALLLGTTFGLTFGSTNSELALALCEPKQNQTLQKLDKQVTEAILTLDQISGFKNEDLKDLKPQLLKTWKSLIENKSIEINGTDKEHRPIFVALQAIIETTITNLLKMGKLSHAHGIIHTPMPATPLCTKGEISKGLVDQIIENDPQRLLTVKARTTIIRDFLNVGGHLTVAYPEEGFLSRTPEQQNTYLEEVKKYPNLEDYPLSLTIPKDLIGATYYLVNNEDIYVFSIKINQANDPTENGDFGLWFGSPQDPVIAKRNSAVESLLQRVPHRAFPWDPEIGTYWR